MQQQHLKPDVDRRLVFGAQRRSTTRVRVWHPQLVIVCSEIESNRGPSITNDAGRLAIEVEHVLQVSLTRYRLVEHYNAASYPGRRAMATTLDEVTFGYRDSDTYVWPAWRPVDRDDPLLGWLWDADL